MPVKLSLMLMFLSLFMLSCKSTDSIRKTTRSLEVKEITGMTQYKKGNYEQAFHLLKEPAAWGYKGSQYALAFMFLKGQYVEQSVLLGMGWLGVAKEANVRKWNEQYDDFYAFETPAIQNEIDTIVAEYIRRYGLSSQHVTCRKSINTSSNRVDVKCHKYDGLSILYEVDLVE
ncbi:MAG: TPR repeat protein [Colwellia polaris]|jgi:TPR repeat protein